LNLSWLSNECLDVYDCTFDFNGYAKAVAFGVYAPTLHFDDYDQTLDLDVYILAQISILMAILQILMSGPNIEV
jgi:hypothetical protein